MNKFYVYLSLIVFIFSGTFATYGYFFKETPVKEPERVVSLNKGGKVIFTHKYHTDILGVNCELCHHMEDLSEEDVKLQSCHECHNDNEDAMSELSAKEAYHIVCIDCHNESMGPGAGDEECAGCHREH